MDAWVDGRAQERWKMSKMIQRQTMDEYLDGVLDATAARELESAVAGDPAAARLLARMKSERAARAAAYASYTPTEQESARYAAAMMEAAYAPVGRIGLWSGVRRLAGVAAAIAVLAGTFYLGRTSAPVNTVATHELKPILRVVVTDAFGQIERISDDFASEDEVREFIKGLNQSGVNYASIDIVSLPGQL
jgi:anti-sigma factor RsiW